MPGERRPASLYPGSAALAAREPLPLYEIILRYHDRDEVRLADEPPPVGKPFEMAGRIWFACEADPDGSGPNACYICIELRGRSQRLREESERLLSRGAELRARSQRPRDRYRGGLFWLGSAADAEARSGK
jgi:hypothetical protein